MITCIKRIYIIFVVLLGSSACSKPGLCEYELTVIDWGDLGESPPASVWEMRERLSESHGATIRFPEESSQDELIFYAPCRSPSYYSEGLTNVVVRRVGPLENLSY